jgi:uncharacterized protein YutD
MRINHSQEMSFYLQNPKPRDSKGRYISQEFSDVFSRFNYYVEKGKTLPFHWVWKGAYGKDGKPRLWWNGYGMNPARYGFIVQNKRKLSSFEKLFNVCGEITCINPDHFIVKEIKPKEKKFNEERKRKWSEFRNGVLYCGWGHNLELENSFVGNTRKQCRLCTLRRKREYNARKKLQ